MAYLIGLCISLILTAVAVSAKCDIFDFGIPATDTATEAIDVNTKCEAAEKNLCLYVGLDCQNNQDATRPNDLTNAKVIQAIVDMLASAETYFQKKDPKDYGFKHYNSENGKKVLGLFLDTPKTKELIRKRSPSCFSNIKQTFETIIHYNNITQNFTEFVTYSPFDDQHCSAARNFNYFLHDSSHKITGCDNEIPSIVGDVFEDVRVHLNPTCTSPKSVVPDDTAAKRSSSSSSSSRVMLGSIHAILLSVILVKIY